MKILISIGHGKSASGGYDSGALGNGYHEFRLARDIGKYTRNALTAYDCTATVINYDADKYLTDRINYANKNKYDLALEIHLNAGGGTGSEVYYKIGNTQGKKLAQAISKNIADVFGIKNRGAKVKTSGGKDYFGFVREVKCQSLLIETVFIDTKSDCDKVASDAGRRVCGEAIAKAIIDMYALKKKTSKPTTSQTATPTSPISSTKIESGDTVKITSSYYATGQKIPAWVKLSKHTVKSVSGSKVLLKEINSYVLLEGLTLISKAKKGISINSVVTINKGAVYGGLAATRGKAIPTVQLTPKKHTVSKIQKNKGVEEALLKEIKSWVAISSLTEVN